MRLHRFCLLTLGCCLLSSASIAASLYIDGTWGSNGWDGASNVITNGHGPVRNIATGLASANDGDTLNVAAGFYQEFTWDAGNKSVTICPQGTVTVYQSDPWQNDSDHDGIPDNWEMVLGLNPFDPSDANQTSTKPWAHGLTNLQVSQNPSVLLADNYSTINDGIPDWWKVTYGFSLTDTTVASGDLDGDGLTNLAEYQLGTDPTKYDTAAPVIHPNGGT